MAYRYGDRNQKALFPQSIDEYIPQDAPVRAYDAIIDSLDFRQLGIELDTHKVGCPQYDPNVMLKLLVYGYSYGVRSSRKLEREIHYNLSFIWLCGGLKPDHKTIAEFRRQNKSGLTKVLKQCARLCIELDLIEGNTLFVDGSKIRGNASIKNTWTKERCERSLKGIERRIEQILNECDQQDRQEEGRPSLVKLKEELNDQQQLKSKVKDILEKLKQADKSFINTTDPDCCRFHTSTSSGTGYNAQSVVDEKHGLIVSSDVVNDNIDYKQFAVQVNNAIETMGKKPDAACADCGFFKVDELENIDKQGIKVIVPSQRQIADKPPTAFDRSSFTYDERTDCYICPEGNILKYRRTEQQTGKKIYRIKRSTCLSCKHFGICTESLIGRKVVRLVKERLRGKFESIYKQPDSQQIYNLRKQKVELPFGHMKRNLKMDGFLLRRLDGVKAEMSLLASCFDIARMITLVGVKGLIARLGV
jgi:transposase